MSAQFFRCKAILFAAAMLTVSPAIHAEEGMWTFDNPPLKQLAAKYNFHPSQAWLDHLRLSSVRLNDGGSGSFVSADGLLLTKIRPVGKIAYFPWAVPCLSPGGRV